MNDFTKFLYGCALGDGLGLPVEGWTRQSSPFYAAKMLRGFSWIDRYLRFGFHGQVSDDTQLTICLAKTFIQKGFLDPEYYMMLMSDEWHNKRLLGVGIASMQAFNRYREGLPASQCGSPQNMAGNGAAMRAGLTGLWYKNETDVINNAITAARLTHRDSRSVAAAVVMALVVRMIIREKHDKANAGTDKTEDSRKAIINIINHVSRAVKKIDPVISKTIGSIDSVLGANLDDALAAIVTCGYDLPAKADPKLILGISGFSPTSIGWVLYCLASYPDDTDSALRLMFAGGGDLDTNASMLCSLLCLKNGLNDTLRGYVYLLHDRRRWRHCYLGILGARLEASHQKYF